MMSILGAIAGLDIVERLGFWKDKDRNRKDEKDNLFGFRSSIFTVR